MPNYAILHTASRVIRRLTSDDPPTVAADETAVTVAGGFDLAGGPWKLDAGGSKVAPTQAEIDAADVDPVRTTALQRQFLLNYLASLDGIIAAGTQAEMAAALKDWAARQKKLVQGLFR